MKRKRVRTLLVALAATVVCAAQLQAQATGEVRGFVLDNSTAAPLGEVTITVAGQTVFSAAQGFYVVQNVPAGVHTLTANLIGYRTFETQVTVTAGQTTDVEIRLSLAPLEMAPIVAVGYGELEAKDQTGVVTEVPAEAFNTGQIVSAEQLIQAKVAGVQVTEDSNEPGAGISIRIRGGTSINASNEPLYVIDGVPLDVGGGLVSAGGGARNPLNFINPDDIASFTVLKDASATAIYGSRGANGVVLIETTAGRARAGQGATVSYTGRVSGSQIYEDVPVLNASQFRAAVQEQAPEKLALLGTANTDWQKAVQQSAFGQDHTLAVAVGGDKMDFRGSFGYQNQEGIIRRSTTERASLNFAYNQLLFDDKLSLQANVVGARLADTAPGGGVLGNATNMAPTQPIKDANSIYAGYFEWDDALAANNPVGELMTVDQEAVTYRSIGNVTGEYQLPDNWVRGLSVTGRFGYTSTNVENKFFAPSFNRNQAETGLGGTVSRGNPSEFSWLGDAFLTYNRNFDGGRHTLNATGGYSYQQWRTDSPSFFAQELSSDLLGIDGIPAAELERTSLNVQEHKLASWFARANYSFLDRYILTATFRADGSSRFGEDNRWGYFPSFAGAWRLSEESFMDGSVFSDLRLRVSWGKNGNEPFGNYLQFKDYVFGDPLAQYQFGDQFVSTIRPSAADPNIKWEETSSWNFGLDFGFADQRYWGSLEFYTKDTDDLLFSVPVAAGTNLSNFVTTNIGSMNNKGIEATLNAAFIEGQGDEFSWDANFNVAYNQNELTAINPFAGSATEIRTGGISGGVGSFIQILRPGEPVNSFYVYEHILDGSGNPIYEDTNADGTINEQDLYVDQNGDGIINQDDLRVFNNPAPDWIFGHTSLMRWNRFDFSLTLLAQLGNYVYNNTSSTRGFYDQLRDQTAPNNLHESVLETSFGVPQYFSDYYVEDASFLRINNVELGYTFQNWLNGVRVYAVAQNLLTITGYSGIDPTAGINGIDNNIYPAARTFTAGLNVRF